MAQATLQNAQQWSAAHLQYMNFVSSNDFFSERAINKDRIKMVVHAFCEQHGLSKDTIQPRMTAHICDMIEAASAAGGRSLNNEACKEIFVHAFQRAVGEAATDTSLFASALQRRLEIPQDIVDACYDCIRLIKAMEQVERRRATASSMRDTFYQVIIPDFMSKIVDMMKLLPQLSGDDRTAWYDQLEELGYTFVILAQARNKIVGGFAPIGQVATAPSLIGPIFNDWSRVIETTYGNTLSPWTTLLDMQRMKRFVGTTDKRDLLGKTVEFEMNFGNVNMQVELPENTSSVVAEFINI